MKHAKASLLLVGFLVWGAGHTGIYAAGLSGGYTIGAGGNYPTLGDAVYAYNYNGLAGNTTFEFIGNTTETAQVGFDYNKSNGYTLTITVDNTKRTISGSVMGALIKLNGTSNVIFDGTSAKNLVITNTQTGTLTQCIEVAEYNGKSKNVIIRNVELYNTPTETISGTSNIKAIAADITIENCNLHNAYEGVVVAYTDKAILKNNVVSKMKRSGFSISNAYPMECVIEGNNFADVTNTSEQMLYGIHFTATSVTSATGTCRIENNVINNVSNLNTADAGAYGMALYTDGELNVSNNKITHISNITTVGDHSGVGITCTLFGNGIVNLNANTIDNVTCKKYPFGIEVASASSSARGNLTNNVVSNIINGSGDWATGIRMLATGNVSTSKIYNVSASAGVATGILGEQAFNTSVFSNNMAANINGKSVYGFWLNSGAGYKAYHNTVYLTTATSAAICFASNVVADVRNNLLVNNVTSGSAYNHVVTIANGSTLSGNRYYFATGNGYIGIYNAGIFSDINIWNNTTNDLSIRVTTLPTFLSPTSDLHLAAPSNTNPLLHTNLLATDVPKDFDGDTRTACSNAAGADNFVSKPAFTISNIVPTLQACQITVSFEANGGVPPFQYSYNNTNFQNAINETNRVTANGAWAARTQEETYSTSNLYLKDANGCIFTSSPFVVNNPGMNPNAVTTTLYVKTTPSGDGTGKDWNNAFDGKFLAQYLRTKAVDGTKIYVATGTYLPYLDGCDNAATMRTYSFELNKAVELRGGYSTAATGTDLSSYAPITNITRLSGEIQGDNDPANNSYHVVVIGNTTVVMDGFYISGGSANSDAGNNGFGGGILNSSGIGSDLLSNLVVENNNALSGGGIYLSNASLLDHVTVSDNRSENSGGGIFISNQSTSSLTIVNSSVTGNTAGDKGGGIYSDAPATVDNSQISGNKAGYNVANGVFNSTSSGGGMYINHELTLQGDIVLENNTAGAGGGALFKNVSGSFTTTTLTSLKVIGNTAITESGGGIYSNAGFSINNGIISDNRSGNNGGGIHAGVSAPLILNNVSFSGNKTDQGMGGGLRADNALTLSGGIAFVKNSAQGSGGAIWKLATGNFITTGLTSLIIDENTAVTGNGGGIYSNAGISITSGTITGNTAGTGGGGIHTDTNAPLTLGNVTVSGNKAGYDPVSQTYITAGNGGGIRADNALTLTGNIVLENNVAYGSGGAIWKGSGTFTTTGSTVKVNNNEARTGTGGGIHTGAGFTADGWTITNNQAGNEGGGIRVNSGVNVVFSSSSITGNSSVSNGGGISANSSLTLNNVIVLDNKAGYNKTTQAFAGNYSGGGIYAGNNLTLSGTLKCNGNNASQHGGGIYKHSTASTTFDASGLTSLQVDGNSAGKGVTGAGGGIYTHIALVLGNLTTGTSISNNTATGTGGGIHAVSTLTLSNATVNNNTAGSNGGGVYASGDYQSNANTYTGNKAVNGGGIYLNNTATVTNNTFSANTATTSGGAVYANNSAHSFTFSTFNGNMPSAVYFVGSADQILSGNILYGNGTQEINTIPATANYNIVRGMDLGTTNRSVAAGQAANIFANITSGDIATLADNGGPTQTLNIKQNGDAYNLIPNDVAASWTSITTDQRGLPRLSGCKIDAGAVELQVGAQQNPDATILGASSACTGDEVVFSAQTTGLQSYLWSVTPNGNMKDYGITAQETFTWTTTGTKTVKLTVTDGENCDTTATLTIDIKQRSETGPLYRVPNLQ